MKSLAVRGLVVAGLAGLVVLTFAMLAVAGSPAQPIAAQAPGDEPRFKAGDTLTVTAENARLMVGSQVLATLTKGQQIVVVEVREAWIGTLVAINGKQTAGWIQVADFVAVAAPTQPQVYTVASPVEAQPAQSRRVAAEPRPVPNHYDAYYYGYYIRHETTPDVHVWEPWRQ